METAPETPKRSLLATIFISPDERRLRAGWRLLLHTVLLIFLGICLGLPLGVLLANPAMLSSGQDNGQALMILNGLISILAVTVSVLLARRFIDRRSFVSLGLQLNRQALYDVLAGIAITFFMMGAIYAIENALGWLRFEGFAWQQAGGSAPWIGLLIWGMIFLGVGWYEELLSRGYHLQNFADGTNVPWGVVLSSLIFGLLHLGNPNSSWVAVVGIFLAGFFLAYGYTTTRQLWLPIGLHIGWNFFEGVVFGFPVSGLTTFRLINQSIAGPELWTGGAFGPEAGLILLPALALGTILIYAYTRPAIRSKL